MMYFFQNLKQDHTAYIRFVAGMIVLCIIGFGIYFILNATIASIENEQQYVSDVTAELKAISENTNFDPSTELGKQRHNLLNQLHADECIIESYEFVSFEEIQQRLRTSCGSVDSADGVFIGRYRAYQVRPVDNAKNNLFR